LAAKWIWKVKKLGVLENSFSNIPKSNGGLAAAASFRHKEGIHDLFLVVKI
jgi:hypothetical protein